MVYNAGYLEGRDLPPGKELLEHIPIEMFDTAHHIANRGAFLVAKQALPAMREAGRGSFLFSNNNKSLRGTKRNTGESFYYPRVMMRALAQVLTEEYSEHGVHVANVVIDGLIDSPGTRTLPRALENPEAVIDPAKIAEAFYYLYSQDRSCWTHELQLLRLRRMQKLANTASTAWLLLGCAVALETAGVMGLRFSQGFTLPWPTVGAVAAFALALYLVSRVMKQLPVSVAYPIWAGGGTAGVAIVGMAALGEEVNAAKAIGIALVIAGVVAVNRVSEKTAGC